MAWPDSEGGPDADAVSCLQTTAGTDTSKDQSSDNSETIPSCSPTWLLADPPKQHAAVGDRDHCPLAHGLINTHARPLDGCRRSQLSPDNGGNRHIQGPDRIKITGISEAFGGSSEDQQKSLIDSDHGVSFSRARPRPGCSGCLRSELPPDRCEKIKRPEFLR